MFIIKRPSSFHYWGGGRTIPTPCNGWREHECEATFFSDYREALNVCKHMYPDNPGCEVIEVDGPVGSCTVDDKYGDYDRAMRGI